MKEDLDILRAWIDKMWADLHTETTWNRLMREKGYAPAQITVQPLRKRIRRTIKNAIERRREWLALKIAPWLESEDDRW